MATTETDRPAAVQGEVRMLIDGELVEASSGKTFDNINPATEEVLGRGRRRVGARTCSAPSPRPAARSTRPTGRRTTRSASAASQQLQEAIESEQEELRAELVAEVGCPIALTYGPQLDAPLERRASSGRPSTSTSSSGSASSPTAHAFGGNCRAHGRERKPPASSAPSCRGTTRSRCRRRSSARRSPPATR